MKRFKTAVALLSATIMASASFAQDAPPPPPPGAPPAPLKEKSEEIIIRKKGGKEEKMTIVVDGDKVTVNGKPVEDMKDGNVRIIKRKKKGDGDEAHVNVYSFPDGGTGMSMFKKSEPGGRDMEHMKVIKSALNKAMLGVMTTKDEDGVKITEVTKESGAEKAGLKKDDIITKVGENAVGNTQELTEAIGKYKAGDKVNITYKRNGKESKTTATLTENKGKRIMMNLNGEDMDFDMPEIPELPELMERPEMQNFSFNMNRKPRLGLQIQDLEEGKGVKVKDVDEDSPAAKAGLKEGDVITQVNGKDINGVDELRTQTKEVKEGETIKLNYTRDGKAQSVDLKLPKRLKTADL